MNRTITRSKLSVFVLAAPMVALLALSARAEEEMPAADALIEKMIAAAGGKDAMDKITSRVVTISMTIPGMNMPAPMRMTHRQVEGKIVSDTDMGQLGKSTRGTDGAHAWEISPRGPRLMTGDELKTLLDSAHMHELLVMDRVFKEKKVSGIENVDTFPCYRLELVKASDSSLVVMLVDKATFLPRRQTSALKTQRGEMSTAMAFDDYRAVDGVQMPHKMTINQGPMTVAMTVEKYEHNVPIDAATFQPPPAVQALIDKAAAGGGAKPAEGGTPPPPAGEGGDKPTTKPKG